MGGDHGLSDLRFDGYDNQALAQQVEGLRNGLGSASLNDAVSALMALAEGLADTDEALRQQLAEIGVSWQGEAADGGTSATENASIYAEQSQGPVTDSAQGVESQSDTFSTTKNGAPDAGSLRGPTELNGVDQFAGFFGHTTDHAQEVKDTNASRQQAVDSLNGYQANSSQAIDKSQALPVPPGLSISAQPADMTTHTSSVNYVGPGSGLAPGSASGSGPATSLTPGGGPVGPAPTTTPNPPGPPVTPGPGPLPGNPSIPTTAGQLPSALRAAMNPLLMADAATALGVGGANGAGAGAERERLARNPGTKGAIRNGVPIGAAPDEEARAARNAERFGAKAGRPGGSIMQPAAAAAGRNAEGEEDKEHVRRYGVESSDVFDDQRTVAPESIGDEDDEDDDR